MSPPRRRRQRASGSLFTRRTKAESIIAAAESFQGFGQRHRSTLCLTRNLGEDSRLELSAEVRVPRDGPPALLLISRPYFDGYQARIGDQTLPVETYRGWIPIIHVPAGTEGRLTISYRPWWLLWGGAIAVVSAVVWLVCAWRAWRR